MTLAAANPGGWSLNEILTSAQMNSLQDELLKAIDGLNGGTYALQSDLDFDGPANVRILAELQVPSGGLLIIEPSGDFTVNGDMDVNNGNVDFGSSSELNIASGCAVVAAFDSSCDLLLEAGVGFLTEDIGDLQIDDQVLTYRVVIAPAEIEESGGGAYTWSLTDADSNGFFLQTDVSPGSGAQLWIPFRVEPSDQIGTIIVTFDGNGTGGAGHGALPSTMPKVSLIVNGSVVGTATDASASVGAYEINHTVSLVINGNAIDSTYYLLINGEAGANSVNGLLKLKDISSTITRRRLVSAKQM